MTLDSLTNQSSSVDGPRPIRHGDYVYEAFTSTRPWTSVRHRVVAHILGAGRYLCVRAGYPGGWRRECQSIRVDEKAIFHSNGREPTVRATRRCPIPVAKQTEGRATLNDAFWAYSSMRLKLNDRLPP